MFYLRIMNIRFKGYYEDCFTIAINAPINTEWKSNEYICFQSRENLRKIFWVYKEEMHQGGKPRPGVRVLNDTGFFDLGKKHWSQFERFNPTIIYHYTIVNDNLIEIVPISNSDFICNSKVFGEIPISTIPEASRTSRGIDILKM